MGIAIRGLAPLLVVFDMPTSIAFYRDMLGFEVVGTSTPADYCHWALLRLQGVELMLEPAYVPRDRPLAADPGRVGGHADTALYFACPDVDGAYAHLRAKGLTVKEPQIATYGMKQLYVTDPDGFKLCFQWRATQERAGASA